MCMYTIEQLAKHAQLNDFYIATTSVTMYQSVRLQYYISSRLGPARKILKMFIYYFNDRLLCIIFCKRGFSNIWQYIESLKNADVPI